MIRTFCHLTCDVCRATLPENLPGNAAWARARAKLDHGWRVMKDAAGLPRDICAACARRAAREAALARVTAQYGEEEA